MSMTLNAARKALAIAHIELRNSHGRIRVNFNPGFESTAQYVDTLQDAIDVGLAMSHARTMRLIEELNAGRHKWSRHRLSDQHRRWLFGSAVK